MGSKIPGFNIIDNMNLLQSELAAWEQQRNEEQASINGLFDVDQARTKLHRAYDKLTGQVTTRPLTRQFLLNAGVRVKSPPILPSTSITAILL